MSRLISIWSQKPVPAPVKHLADYWSEKGKAVIQVRFDPDAEDSFAAARIDPAEWVARYEPLSPLLLRNYFGSLDGGGALSMPRLPAPASLTDLLRLLRRSYDWVLVTAAPDYSAAGAALLDESDLLLWLLRDRPESRRGYQTHLDELTRLHFAHALSQVVWLDAAPQQAGLCPEWTPGKPALAALPEDSSRPWLLREAVQRLAAALETRQDLYPAEPGAAIEHDGAQKAVEELKNRVQPQLVNLLARQTLPESEAAQKTAEACLAEDAGVTGSREVRNEILSRVLDEVMGLGPLEPLLKDPGISEVMVNGKGGVYIERKGKLFHTEVAFSSENQLRTLIDRIVAPIGRRVDESMPLCDARLPDGSRVNIVLPPLSLDGPVITIRKFMARALTLDDLIGFGSLNRAMADFLSASVLSRRNIVVSGGTGSGKTTLLNALSSLIPDDERIVTIEDAAELRLAKPHVIRLESRPPNAEGEGAIPIRRLVINALRMRPDRIVVGECRGAEALDMLQAMNTGHDGSLTTVHANSPRDALGRLETLVLMSGIELPLRVVREQIRSGVHLILQQARLSDGSRKIVSLTELTGMEGDVLVTQELFRFRGGAFESTRIAPAWSHAS